METVHLILEPDANEPNAGAGTDAATRPAAGSFDAVLSAAIQPPDTRLKLAAPANTDLSSLSNPRRGHDGDDAARLASWVAARAERAADLVRSGAVEAMGGDRYRVRGWSVRPGYCNCPDFAWRGQVPCKHLIAVELVRSIHSPAA